MARESQWRSALMVCAAGLHVFLVTATFYTLGGDTASSVELLEIGTQVAGIPPFQASIFR